MLFLEMNDQMDLLGCSISKRDATLLPDRSRSGSCSPLTIVSSQDECVQGCVNLVGNGVGPGTDGDLSGAFAQAARMLMDTGQVDGAAVGGVRQAAAARLRESEEEEDTDSNDDSDSDDDATRRKGRRRRKRKLQPARESSTISRNVRERQKRRNVRIVCDVLHQDHRVDWAFWKDSEDILHGAGPLEYRDVIFE